MSILFTGHHWTTLPQHNFSWQHFFLQCSQGTSDKPNVSLTRVLTPRCSPASMGWDKMAKTRSSGTCELDQPQ